jgi:TctA family transporter
MAVLMITLGDTFDNIMLGLETALQGTNLFYCVLGVTLGTLLGVLPGIGVLISISLLFPLTFYLDPTAALVMLAGIFYGTTYGGSTSAILLNVPGTPSAAVSCLDGYPMSKQGRAGVALVATTIASFVGGSIGIVLLMMFSPIIVENALRFGPHEYFALMVMGLVAASTITQGSPVKGIAMVLVGILLGLVQADFYTGLPRFSFGMLELYEGISLVALAMGMFGVSEVIGSIRMLKSHGSFEAKSITFRSMVPTRDDVRRSWFPMLRGSAIGAFFGTLPGTGGLIASFMAYAMEKKVARDPSRFGKGAIEGLMGPESANNAADQTAFIPTLTLGIPGTPAMAIMLAVLIVHGITPGPNLIVERPELFWGVVMSFWIGNLLLLVLNIPMIGVWVKLLTVPYHLLYPAILMFVCLGVYSINNSSFEVWTLVFFSALGYVLRLLDFSAAPLLLGFVLGPAMEEHFRRAMLISRGDFMSFVERPLTLTIMSLTFVMLAWALWAALRPSPRKPER